jgi:hypothetical protein
MTILILFIVSISGLYMTLQFMKKNFQMIKDKEDTKINKAWGYSFSTLWYGYLFVFFAGLVVNNLFPV